jgi:hypothetical protein
MLASARMLLLRMLAPTVLVAVVVARSTRDDQPLKVTPELASQRYCYGDAEVFTIRLKLRVKYVNLSDKTLILGKEIGKAWYRVRVAKNLEDLRTGRYEYNPITDWFFQSNGNSPQKPSPVLPGPDVAILAPGQAFVSEINTHVVAQYENPKDFAGSIRPGVHMLQMDLSAWNRPGDASEFEKVWQKFGQLVTGVLETEPLAIRVPSNPKVEKECK